MDHTTMWLAHERTIEAPPAAAEIRRARTSRRAGPVRSLLRRIRDGR